MALKLSGPDTDRDRDEEKKAELTEHLAELRTRLIRSCVYLFVGMAAVYVLSSRIERVLMAPINSVIQSRALQTTGQGQLPPFAFHSFTDGFFLTLQIATVGGLFLLCLS